jgi:hypothetical protein
MLHSHLQSNFVILEDMDIDTWVKFTKTIDANVGHLIFEIYQHMILT